MRRFGAPSERVCDLVWAAAVTWWVLIALCRVNAVLPSLHPYALLVAQVAPLGLATAMLLVGVVEITAGLVVAVRPRFGGYLVAAWLLGIIVNLVTLGDYYDVALRDFGLFVAALASLGPLLVSGEAQRTYDVYLYPPLLGEIHLVSSVGFDIGVFLVVVGLTLDVLRTFGSRLDRHILREEQARDRGESVDREAEAGPREGVAPR